MQVPLALTDGATLVVDTPTSVQVSPVLSNGAKLMVDTYIPPLVYKYPLSYLMELHSWLIPPLVCKYYPMKLNSWSILPLFPSPITWLCILAHLCRTVSHNQRLYLSGTVQQRQWSSLCANMDCSLWHTSNHHNRWGSQFKSHSWHTFTYLLRHQAHTHYSLPFSC